MVAAAFLLFGLCSWSRAQEAVVRRVDNAKDTAVSLDVIELESGYVFESDLNRNGSFGEQSAVQNSFGYGHRFFLSGHLYLHLGVEYDRFDFGATGAPVPDHLQSVAAIIGVDYMHNDDVGAFIQIKPGIYTQDNFDSAAFDAPITLGRVHAIRRELDYHRADIRYKADGAPYLRLEFKAKF